MFIGINFAKASADLTNTEDLKTKDRSKVREQRPQVKQDGDGWTVLKRYRCPKISLVV